MRLAVIGAGSCLRRARNNNRRQSRHSGKFTDPPDDAGAGQPTGRPHRTRTASLCAAAWLTLRKRHTLPAEPGSGPITPVGSGQAHRPSYTRKTDPERRLGLSPAYRPAQPRTAALLRSMSQRQRCPRPAPRWQAPVSSPACLIRNWGLCWPRARHADGKVLPGDKHPRCEGAMGDFTHVIAIISTAVSAAHVRLVPSVSLKIRSCRAPPRSAG